MPFPIRKYPAEFPAIRRTAQSHQHIAMERLEARKRVKILFDNKLAP
jgi:hypothetical protein